jgi:GGDEF domain-containing protein
MPDESHLKALHSAVHSYLSLVSAVGDCLATSCPAVGGVYRHRLDRLRARLAFDSSPQALEESSAAVEEELREFASAASAYVAGHGVQLKMAIGALEDIVWSLAERQGFYGGRLRQFAEQMEHTPYPAEPEDLENVVALQAAGLLNLVESMGHVTESLVTRMHQELAAAERRVLDAEVADPLTGLLNRREMDTRIEARKATGETPILLHFGVTGPASDEVLKQVADRLDAQFRHHDALGRWATNEFMVLFNGPVDVAQSRAELIVPWVSGRYTLSTGEQVDVPVEVRLFTAAELETSVV